jgi:hypothetical protein
VACKQIYFESLKTDFMKNWIFTLILALQGMVFSYAQSEALFASWDANQKTSLEAYYTQKSGFDPISEFNRISFSSSSEPLDITFNGSITSFSLSKSVYISETPKNKGEARFEISGYNQYGEEIVPHCFTRQGEAKTLQLGIDDLSGQPIFLFEEKVSRIRFAPSGIQSGGYVQFNIDGVSSQEFSAGYRERNPWAEGCSLDKILLVFDNSGSISNDEMTTYKQHAWSELSKLAGKQMSLQIAAFGNSTVNQFYLPAITEADFEPGSKLYEYFFDTNESIASKEEMQEMTNFHSVMDFLIADGAEDKAIFIYTDGPPNYSVNQTYLPVIAGVTSFFTAVSKTDLPLQVITNNGQLLGLSELQEKSTKLSLCAVPDEVDIDFIISPCIDEDRAKMLLEVSPTPCRWNFTIECQYCDAEESYTAVLKDLAGRDVIERFKLTGEQTTVDTRNLASGSYFLWIQSDNAQVFEPIPVIIAR